MELAKSGHLENGR